MRFLYQSTHFSRTLRASLKHAYAMFFGTLVIVAITSAIPPNQSLSGSGVYTGICDESGAKGFFIVEFPDGLPAKELAGPDMYLMKSGNVIEQYSPGSGPSYNPHPLTSNTTYQTCNLDPGSDYTLDLGMFVYMAGAEWGTCTEEYNAFEDPTCEPSTYYPETLRIPPYGSQTYSYMGTFSIQAGHVTKLVVSTRYNTCSITGDCAGVSNNDGYGDILITADNLGDGTNLPSLHAIDRNYAVWTDPNRKTNVYLRGITHGPDTSYLLRKVVPNSNYQLTFGSQSQPINSTFASTATWGTCTFARGGQICTPSSFSSIPLITGVYGNAERYAGTFSVSSNNITRVVVKYGEAADNAELAVRRVNEFLTADIAGTAATHNSQTSANNPAVFQTSSGQQTITVTDLPDTKERYATTTYTIGSSANTTITATTSYSVFPANACNGTVCSLTVNVPANQGLMVSVSYQPLKYIVNAKAVVCDSEEDLPNLPKLGTVGDPQWADDPVRGGVVGDAADDFVAESDGNCQVEDGWDFQWGFSGQTSPMPPTHTGAAPSTGYGTYYDFDTTSGETGAGSFAQAFIYDDPTTTIWLTGDPDAVAVQYWFKTNLKEGYLPFTTPPYQQNGGNPYSSEFICDVDQFNFDNWEWIRPHDGHTTYWCYMLTAEEENGPAGTLQVHRVNSSGQHLATTSPVSINPPVQTRNQNPASFSNLSSQTNSTTVTFPDIAGYTEHVAVCSNLVTDPTNQECEVADSDYDYDPGEPYSDGPLMPTCNGTTCTFTVGIFDHIETHMYVKYVLSPQSTLKVLRVTDYLDPILNNNTTNPNGPIRAKINTEESDANPFTKQTISPGTYTVSSKQVDGYTVQYATCQNLNGNECYTGNQNFSAANCPENNEYCSVSVSVPDTGTSTFVKVVFRYKPVALTLQCSVSRTSVPLGGTVTYSGVSNYNSNSGSPMEFFWSGSFGNPSQSITCPSQWSPACQRITVRFNQAGTAQGITVQGRLNNQTLSATCPAVNVIRSSIIEQ